MGTVTRIASALWMALCLASAARAEESRPMNYAIRMVAGGIEAARGDARIAVTALRDDVIRVRVGRTGLPRDESWAALPDPRAARAAIVPCGPACFETGAARARLDPATGAVTVEDRDGRPVMADAEPADAGSGGAVRVAKRLPEDARVFGLGDKAGPLDRRGRVLTLWNTDAYRYQETSDPLYKAVPFLLTMSGGRAAGLFVDTTWRSVFDVGVTRPDVLSVTADGGAIDYYVFTGPDPKSVLSAYAWLTGPPPLPPLWAFGFQQSRYSYDTEVEARAVADRLRADRIPADVIWFDIGALDGRRAFTFNRAGYPDFPGLVAELRRRGLRSVIITDLHLAAEPGYAPYDSGAAGDHFLYGADGARFVGPVWPGPCVFPDFSRASTRAWWGGLFRKLYATDGFAGFWNDMNEPAVFRTPTKTMPLDVRHRIEEPGFETRVATHAEMHNVYGMLNSRATFEGMLSIEPDRRPFVMTRASYAGGQRYAVTWTGDNSSTWNHLRLSTPQLLSLGLSGFAFAGDDLGGFAGSPLPDLLTRWLQVGAFNPIMRDHTDLDTRPQEPWVHGPEHEAIRRRFIEARYRLMPYIYAAAEEASRTGVPMMRPMFLEFPDVPGGRVLDVEASQFMWGRALLVAPPPWGESPDGYGVILPPGEWFDFWTGLKVAPEKVALPEGETRQPPAAEAARWPHRIGVSPGLADLPVFVRAGSIVPSQPLVQSTAESPGDTLTLDVYPGPECVGGLYADDGETLGHLRGAYFRQRVTCAADGRTVTFDAPEGSRPPWWSWIDLAMHEGLSGVARLRIAAPMRETTIRVGG